MPAQPAFLLMKSSLRLDKNHKTKTQGGVAAALGSHKAPLTCLRIMSFKLQVRLGMDKDVAHVTALLMLSEGQSCPECDWAVSNRARSYCPP